MIKPILLALTPLAIVGCTTVVERPVPVTTTTTSQMVAPAPMATTTTREVFVTQAPPPIRVETQTVAPGPNYIWTRGYWQWTGTRYAWVPGRYVVRPRTTAVWVEGQWQRRPGGWVWVAGHWQ